MAALSEKERLRHLARYERDFARAGLPLFIERTSAFERALVRGMWALALVFLLEVLTVVRLERAWWINVIAVGCALAIRLLLVAYLNQRRGRAALSLPDSLEAAEALLFIFAPAVLGVLLGGDWAVAALTIPANLVILALVYAYYGYGLGAVCRWALTHALDELSGSLTLLARALPLLLFFSFVLFITPQLWEIFAGASPVAIAGCTVLFGGVAILFLVVRLPREVRSFIEDAPYELEVNRRQRLNLGIVLFVAQAVQVFVVSLMIGLFFTILGMLIITPQTASSWTTAPVEVLAQLRLFGARLYLTEELLRVAAAIAAFSGLYFAISVLTDATYREEFLEELAEELRGTLRARQEYLQLLRPGRDG